MKARIGVAGVMFGVLAWSMANQGRVSSLTGDSRRDVERNTRSVGALASWSEGAMDMDGAGHQVSVLARGLGQSTGEQASGIPAFFAPSASISPAQIARYEKQLCDLANRERKQRGLPVLQISPVLAEVARAHSREMAAKNYFAHESPTKGRTSPQDRYRGRVKKTPRLIAENIYKLEGSGAYRLKAGDFRNAHTGWMNSPGHRANILRRSPAGGPTQIGVGIVVRGGSFWATQNFARP